ncbi:hexitol dehydrogenase [Schizosaccharomyces japonicus yFS275]|uniref:Hexitol dehydrogenase n=1 Tax=Schizosaccharomyces japonicus (strain yFS275 / FY16936) TaxID=402676 RepID=B6JV36_SCHJY|nr:hexitol dehydrogenase [Schizosaccharomyces japonicus yFS275]EEB05237.1 hexitol dehydrogenase [Schizosaccharomyces japonicus yFS275]
MSELSFVLNKAHDVSFKNQAPDPFTSDHDVRVHITSTGICGSDVHYWKQGRIGDFVVEKPMILGHESSGVVVEVAKNVKSLKPGDRVAVEPGRVCRICDYCRAGHYNLCPHMEFAATPPYDGTLRTTYVTTEDFCTKLPDNISLDEAAIFEPLSVAIHCWQRAQLTFGKRVLVFGCGPVGLLLMAVAKAYGAIEIVAADVSATRTQFAEKYIGAKAYVCPKKNESESVAAYAEKCRTAIKYEHGYFEFTADATGVDTCIHTAVLLLKPGGTFIQAGNGKPVVDFPINHLVNNELSVIGSFRYSAGCYEQALKLVSTGKVPLKPLISHTFAFKEAEEAYKTTADPSSGAIKVIIHGTDY